MKDDWLAVQCFDVCLATYYMQKFRLQVSPVANIILWIFLATIHVEWQRRMGNFNAVKLYVIYVLLVVQKTDSILF